MLVLMLFFCGAANAIAQHAEASYYSWFDTQLGMQNSGLSNGTRYLETYRIYKGRHQYYKDSYFQKGGLVYSGQPYYDVNLKYDISRDEIIVAIPYGSNLSIIQLVKKEIERFHIADKLFIRVPDGARKSSGSRNLNGFFELMLDETQLRLLKKHRKLEQTRIQDKLIYYQFKEANEYYLEKDEALFPVEKKSDWLKLYPEFKNEISAFYRVNRKLIKSDYDNFILRLSSRINTLSNQTNPK